MTALFYIQGSLCDMVDISGMKGKRMMSSLLGISTPITGIFSLVILFYVNSFVMKQRKKEFGLYNVLGMEKRHLVRLMSVEILLVAVFSLVFGISGGALFSQLFFLIFYKNDPDGGRSYDGDPARSRNRDSDPVWHFVLSGAFV